MQLNLRQILCLIRSKLTNDAMNEVMPRAASDSNCLRGAEHDLNMYG